MSKKKLKKDIKTENAKETVDNIISNMEIPLTSSTKDEEKSSKNKNTGDYYRDIYHGKQLGSIVDRIISYITYSKIQIVLNDEKLQKEISSFLKRNEINNLIKSFYKDFLILGKSDVLLFIENDDLDVSLLNPMTAVREVSDLSASVTEFYTIKYKGNYSNVDYLFHYPDFKKFYYDKIDTIKRNIDYLSNTVTPEMINRDGCVIEERFNAFHNDREGYSLFMRAGKFSDIQENYLQGNIDILKKNRGGFLDISVPLANKIDDTTGLDLNVKNASNNYKNYVLGNSLVHGDNEKIEVKEFSPNQMSEIVRRANVLYLAGVTGGSELIYGDAGNVNYATANTMLQLFGYELLSLQDIARSVIEKIVSFYLKFIKGKTIEQIDDFNIQIILGKPFPFLEGTLEYKKFIAEQYEKGYISYSEYLNTLNIDLPEKQYDTLINEIKTETSPVFSEEIKTALSKKTNSEPNINDNNNENLNNNQDGQV